MLTDSERPSEQKMLRTFTSITNRRCIQQQLFQRLNSIGSQSVAMSSQGDNPQNLPHLPVPDLNKTLEKYLTSVKPFLNPSELKTTECLVKEFPKQGGCTLQQFLLDRAKCTTNWLEEWWLNVAYLGYRDPVVVYSSPGQILPFENFKCDDARLAYTAKLIMAAASYKSLIDAKKIPVEKMGKDELDMNQYNKIFGTCRIPCSPIDKLEFNGDSKHIVVVHNNHYFKVELYENLQPISEQQVLEQLKKIMQQSSKPTQPIGILTSDNRDTWAKAFQNLIKSSRNEKSIREIQKSLFLVCLDEEMPDKPVAPNRKTLAARQLIHGGGSCGNAGNRWYDKTVQFVIGKDGIVGLTYEHSPSEGQPIAVMVDYLVNFMKKDGAKGIQDVSCAPELKPLKFDINDKTLCDINTSSGNIDKLVANLNLSCFAFEKYGKEFVKSQKFSPDSFIQIALQYTFYRLHKVPAAHYESAATRKFIGGRTETIRSCSQESVEFAKAMLDDKKTAADRVNALKAAINGHKKYTVEALNGLGVDRHLLGLKLAAQELGVALPALYKDPSYIRSTHMRISSSQVATKCDGFMSYAPLTENGYGCCYNPRPNDINFSVSSFVSNKETSAKRFHNALCESLSDMELLLAKTQTAKL